MILHFTSLFNYYKNTFSYENREVVKICNIYFFSFLLRDNLAMINDQITIHPCQTSKFQRQRPSFEIIFHLSISDKRKRDLFSCTDKMNYLYENWAMSKRCFLSLSPFVIPGSWSIERRKEFPTTLFPIRRPCLPCLLTK